MNEATHQPDRQFLSNAMASFIQIAALTILALWCFSILRPFVAIVIWAIIISVAIYPLHTSLANRLGGRAKTSATILVLAGLAIIVLPAWFFTESSISGLKTIGEGLRSGNVSIPPPNPKVADWPLVGDRIYAAWSGASGGLEDTLNQYSEQLKGLGQRIFGFATGMLVGVLQFVLSMIIAGVLLLGAANSYQFVLKMANNLVGHDSGARFTDLSIQTIRSVFKGVLGVALIQTGLATIGLVLIDIPAPGLWAAAILVVAIVQLPPILILGPIAIWYFSVADGLPATIFLVYSVIVSFSDAALKPLLLGRGVDTPMLVILLGAIGGAITEGIVGLFVGAVVLALGFEILRAWMARGEAARPAAGG